MKLNKYIRILIGVAIAALFCFWVSGCSTFEPQYSPAPVRCTEEQIEYPKPKTGWYTIKIWIVSDQKLIVKACQKSETVRGCAWEELGVVMLHQDDWQCWINHEAGHVLGVNKHP